MSTASTNQPPTAEPSPAGSVLTRVSRARIEALVDQFLSDPTRNIKFIPDRIERKFYTELIYMVLQSLDDVLNNVTINLYGHQIKLDLVQTPDSIPPNNSNE
jgi:hypothetical protein